MALSYLSGMDNNFLGIAEVGKPKRLTSQERASARQERYKAMLAKRRARIAARKARAAAERAALLIQQANATTQTAQALSMDEIGRRKKGGDGGGGSARQEARAARRQAREERQQARQAIRKAKKEALQARRATIKAQRATKRAQAVAARTARAAARQEARAARRAAVPAPMLKRGRGGAAPTPEIEDIEAEVMDDEDSDGSGEESEMESGEDNEAIEGFLGMDEIGRRKKGGDKAEKKAKRKEKRDKRGGSVAKKIALAPVRLALFALMKVNALKVRTKLRQAWKKDKNAVINKIVKRFGFKLDKFLTELNRKESEKLNGAEFGTIATAIATATPAIIAITTLLKQMGINPESMSKIRGKGGTGAGEGEGGEEGTEDVPGKDEGTPGSNFRLSTPLLLGGAAIAAFLLFRKK